MLEDLHDARRGADFSCQLGNISGSNTLICMWRGRRSAKVPPRALFLVTPDVRFLSEDAMVSDSLLVRLCLRREPSLVFVDLSISLCLVLCLRR